MSETETKREVVAHWKRIRSAVVAQDMEAIKEEGYGARECNYCLRQMDILIECFGLNGGPPCPIAQHIGLSQCKNTPYESFWEILHRMAITGIDEWDELLVVTDSEIAFLERVPDNRPDDLEGV